MNETVSTLPTPPADRWQPTRAGLVGLWRYWDETFAFHRGRLLLRGPNGSGKSMALELLLPFLLDADASPTRLTSAAKSRGGLYERVMTGTSDPTRTGFAWVEFRRGGEVFTVGVRLQASEATRKVDPSFFTTSQAVGVDLHLLDEHRAPLTRKALAEALGDRGRVHPSAEEHRAAVREVLFPGFDADRYASVLTALLALRKEKVSQNLDLDKLSDVLSDALPPIDEHDLAVVAEGFERLDRRKAELAALEAELAEVRALAARQREYARVVLAAVAGEVRSAETRRDDVTRTEREARSALDSARDEAATAGAETVALEERLAALDTELDALKSSDAYREGADLDNLRAQAAQLRDLLRRLDAAVERSRADEDEAKAARAAAEEDHARAEANHATALDDLRAAASPVGAEAVVVEATVLDDPDDGERLLQAWARSRHELVAEVRGALEAHGKAVQERAFREERVAEEGEAVDRRHADRRTAEEGCGAAVDVYVALVGEWVSACATVGADRVRAALPVPPDEPAAVAAAVARLQAEADTAHATARQEVAARRADVEEHRAGLVEEHDHLADGRLLEPEPPVWRSDRSRREGAPLWRLVDVAPGVAAAEVDGLEAALVAAGLADAWVVPDGSVALPEDASDLVLSARPVDGRSLADVLVPLDDGPVAAAVVARVLASVPVATTAIGAIDGGPDVLVGTDGTFRLGTAVGRGRVQPAELLGAAARERRRQARLAEVRRAIADADAHLVEFDREAAAVDARREAAVAELATVPDGSSVIEARHQVEVAEVRLAEAEDRLADARRALVAAEDAVRGALRALTALGAAHGLPTTAEGLDEVATVVARLERAGAVWARRARELAAAARGRRRADEVAERTASALAEAVDNHEHAARDLTEVEGKLAALESTIGAQYQDVLHRIAALSEERRTGRDRQRELAGARPELERRIGGLERAVADAEADRERAEEDRSLAHRQFGAVIADGFVSDAEVDSPDGPLDGVTAVLAAARSVAAALDGVVHDGPAQERANARVEERLHHARAALAGRVDVDRGLADDGWWVLRASTGGVRRAAAELAAALADELDQGRAELAADEERLFEQTLAGSVRKALAERIRLANGLVDGINQQLAAVRTDAAGVEVRLRWGVDSDQPEAVKSARALLLRDPADLSDDERVALQEFVRTRVDQARAELEANAPWEARLRETLDYRAWHRFTLQIAHRDWDGFQPATPRRLQRLSTGERSIALHLPMLASIAAHYTDETGRPSGCPRLILLDELFAGVDAVNRAKLFGTFTDWDLDAVFTSDHEWCQYASLDGIAIHHLHPAVGEEPVTSTRFTWDGRRRTLDPTAA